MSEKIFLKLNFDFIVAEIRGVFGSVGVYILCVCVCLCDPIGLHDKSVDCFLSNIGGFRNRGRYCFFVLQRPNFDSEAILIPKIYARLQEITSNFLKNFWGGPQTPVGARAFGARFWALPPYRAPFPKFLDPPLLMNGTVTHCSRPILSQSQIESIPK